MRFVLLFFYLALAAVFPPQAEADRQEVGGETLQRYLAEMERAYQEVDDYVTIFHKQCRVKGKLHPPETILLKFKKPFSVYMKWLASPEEGREAIYVQGRHGNKLVAHRGRFPDLTVKLDPHSYLAMRGNLRSIKDVGIGSIIKTLADSLERYQDYPPGRIEFYDHGLVEVFGQTCRCLEVVLPEEDRSDSQEGRAMVWISSQTGLPVRIAIWDRAGRLIEDYAFEETRLNAGLTEMDFDPANPAYGYWSISSSPPW